MKVLKKPLFWVILLCVEALVLTLVLTHNANEAKKDPKPVVYTYYSPLEPINPTVTLNVKGGTFVFEYSVFSSYIAMGKYELTEDELILRTGDGMYTYVFIPDGKDYVFDASRSSELPKYMYSEDAIEAISPVPDGALFEKG